MWVGQNYSYTIQNQAERLSAELRAAAALTQLMRTLLFGTSPLDPITFTVVPMLLVAAAALASYLPARRSAAVDPVVALRTE